MELILTILLAYLTVSVIYNTLFSVASLFNNKTTLPFYQQKNNRIAVMIPAYKEDGIIIKTAQKALKQDYKKDDFDIVVIADSLMPSTIEELKALPIVLVEVDFEQSTKAKAINETFKQLDKFYDIAVVLDADNEMEPHFITKINDEYNRGYRVIQGHRVAKNKENKLAILDAVSEEINNNIYRKGHQNLGLSSALIGSGMAFDYKLFQKEMSQINAIGGFDKALELSLLKSNVEIRYAENALVYDEKVSREEVFTNQRTRWIAAQIRYGIASFGDAFMHLLVGGNINYFDKSLQFLLPPRLILLGVLGLVTLVSPFVSIPLFAWASTVLLGYITALLLAVPKIYFNRETLVALQKIPKTFFLMLLAFKGFKKAKTNFLHTPHHTA